MGERVLRWRMLSKTESAKSANSNIATIKVNLCISSAAGKCSDEAAVGMEIINTLSTVKNISWRCKYPFKACEPCLRPPTMNPIPVINKTFAKTEPTTAALATSYNPSRTAKIKTKKSGMLPKKDWSKPVFSGPSRSPSASILLPTKLVRAAIASAVKIKAIASLPLAW